MFAWFDARAIHEFAIADPVAAFDLDLFYAQHRRATADYEQAIFLRRQNDTGRAAGRHWL